MDWDQKKHYENLINNLNFQQPSEDTLKKLINSHHKPLLQLLQKHKFKPKAQLRLHLQKFVQEHIKHQNQLLINKNNIDKSCIMEIRIIDPKTSRKQSVYKNKNNPHAKRKNQITNRKSKSKEKSLSRKNSIMNLNTLGNHKVLQSSNNKINTSIISSYQINKSINQFKSTDSSMQQKQRFLTEQNIWESQSQKELSINKQNLLYQIHRKKQFVKNKAQIQNFTKRKNKQYTNRSSSKQWLRSLQQQNRLSQFSSKPKLHPTISQVYYPSNHQQSNLQSNQSISIYDNNYYDRKDMLYKRQDKSNYSGTSRIERKGLEQNSFMFSKQLGQNGFRRFANGQKLFRFSNLGFDRFTPQQALIFMFPTSLTRISTTFFCYKIQKLLSPDPIDKQIAIKLFQQCDLVILNNQNEDGFLDIDDLGPCLRYLCKKSNQKLSKIFIQIDCNNHGRIGFNQVKKYSSRHSQCRLTTLLQDLRRGNNQVSYWTFFMNYRFLFQN